MLRTSAIIMIISSSVAALTTSVKIYIENNRRVVEANGLPTHEHGDFPNSGNPNSIRAQNYKFTIPLNPKKNEKVNTTHRFLFGIALSGVPFDPGTAEYYNNDRRSGWRYEALSGKLNLGIDQSNAHVQPTGAYHYHGIPKMIITGEAMQLIGYSADGFPIYYDKSFISSYSLKKGNRPSGPGGSYDGTFVADYEYLEGQGNLGECNHTFAKTKEYPNGTYLYALTETFPFIPRCFIGTPDQSFAQKRPNGMRGRRGHRHHRRGHHHFHRF